MRTPYSSKSLRAPSLFVDNLTANNIGTNYSPVENAIFSNTALQISDGDFLVPLKTHLTSGINPCVSQ